MNPLLPSCSRRKSVSRKSVGTSAFLHAIVPGIVGGCASALCLYPLEVCETLMQGDAANGRKDSSIDPRTVQANVSGGMTMSMSMTDVRTARMPAVARVAMDASASGKLFRGFDMAALSALFGYTAFFATFELTAVFGMNPAVLLTRNLIAAGVSLLVNTPFQLLKTASVLSDSTTTTPTLLRTHTNNFKNFNHLWKGCLANILSVAFIALQFTLFAVFPTAGASPIQAALIGMVATSLAALIAYPVVSVKTAVMAAPENGEKCIRRIVNVARKMGRNRTLYNGVLTNVMLTTLPAFILFGVQNILA